jgi:hypothetical protein
MTAPLECEKALYIAETAYETATGQEFPDDVTTDDYRTSPLNGTSISATEPDATPTAQTHRAVLACPLN